MREIVFICPVCGESLVADKRAAGLSIPCPSCRFEPQVPARSYDRPSDIDNSAAAIALNWVVGVYAVLDFFLYGVIEKFSPSLLTVVVWFPAITLVWATVIVFRRLRQAATYKLPFYCRLKTSDYWRLFFILLTGNNPMAKDSLAGFYIFTSIALCIFFVLTIIAGLDCFRRREVTHRAAGCVVFAFLLLAWEKNAYVEHYGAHVIGHYLEKPKYIAQYYVQVAPDGSEQEVGAIAEIDVECYFEEYYSSYDDDEVSVSKQRNIQVHKIHLPTGQTLHIQEQTERLTLAQSTTVIDTNGNEWYVKLLNRPATSNAP